MDRQLDIEELRSAVVQDPRNAELRYLLGAEMAQRGDYAGAVMEMSSAIALNPLLHTARFQLGLLHLTLNHLDHAREVLAPLEALNDSAALKHFKRGLCALIEDDFANCASHLRKGIELNLENAPLNKDMEMLTERVVALSAQAATGAIAAPDANPAEDTQMTRTDFSLYGAN
jgi:tetratricopeptide (TPR) repeat protein